MADPNVQEVVAYLCVSDAAAAIDFYTKVYGAKELYRLTEPSERVGHAEITLGNYKIMLASEFPEFGVRSPSSIGGTGTQIYLRVANADSVYRAAIAAGATSLMEPTDQFYGERSAKVRDPWGHEWMINHAIEEVSPAEMQRRWLAMLESS